MKTIPGPNRTGREDKEESSKKTLAEASNRDRAADLIHTAFGEGRLAGEAMCQAVVLLSKGEKDYRGIGLVEVTNGGQD